MIDEKLKKLSSQLIDMQSLKNLSSYLNFERENKSVNKDNWNQHEKDIVEIAKIIASKKYFEIFYIQFNTNISKDWKIIATKIIKNSLGSCMVCSHNLDNSKWIFSCISKDFSDSFTETRHIPIDIIPNTNDVPKTFLEFLKKLKEIDDNTLINISSKVSDAFNEFSIQIHDELTINIFESFKLLSEGIIYDQHNKLELNDKNLKNIRSPIFILLYRLIFILYAESRKIFDVDNEIYYNEFSLEWIKKNWIINNDSIINLKEYEIQNRLIKLFHLIESGSDEIISSDRNFSMRSYFGRLFDRTNHKELEKWKISNKFLIQALSFITGTKDKNNNYFLLDYSELKTRHLGSIYEHLLEFHLTIKNDMISNLSNAEDRITSASYYTPDHIVDYIVKNTIEPLIKKIINENTNKHIQIEKILSLKIIDPAMGSGHFLISAANYMTKRICDIKYKQIKKMEFIEIKREVVRKCIFGVDINPLAVDLANVVLWLETLAHNKPLSFLQSHLKIGNSLIGSNIDQIYDESTTLMEAEAGVEHFKKNVKSFLAFEEFSDDDGSVVRAKINQFKKLRSPGTIYYDLNILLNAITAQQFGLQTPPIGDYRAQVGKRSLDFYNSTENKWSKIMELTKQLKFFHWELEFPEIYYDQNGGKKSNAGFDVVIGNPPYLSAKRMSKIGMNNQKIYFKKIYKCASMIYDLYVIFVEKGISLLKKGGEFGYIIPNKFMVDDYGLQLRNLLLNTTKIQEIVDVSKENVFDDAMVYPHILILTKSNNNLSSYKIKTKIGLENIISKNEISIELFKQIPNNIFTINFSEKELHIIKKIMKLGIPLKTLCDLHCGTAGFAAEKTKSCLIDNDINQSNINFIVTGNIDRYDISLGNVRFLNKRYNMPKLILKENIFTNRKISLFTSPKIVIGGMTKRIEAAYDNIGLGLGVNVYALNNFKIDENYLLGFLNSKLITFYFIIINQAKHLSGDYMAINKNQLSNLSIRPFISAVIDLKLSTSILELCNMTYNNKNDDKLLIKIDELIKQNKLNVVEKIFIYTVTVRNKKKSSIMSLKFLDQLIDNIIYKLYDLSSDEIYILEQKIK